MIDLPVDSLVQASRDFTREDAERRLAAAIADKVAKLFYKHLVRSEGITRPEPSRIE